MPDPAPPARPDPNTYWIVPGRFLAGEYPDARDPAKAREKVAAFLAAGVTRFVDLTEAANSRPTRRCSWAPGPRTAASPSATSVCPLTRARCAPSSTPWTPA